MSPRHPSRATPQDLASLYAETARTPMCIGVVAILDGERLALPSVRAAVERRLQLVPRLRQRLLRPAPGLGRPVWVDDPGFDIADHVHARRLPPDAGEAELLAACEELGRARLDRSRPLWELWLLPGLAGGRTGVFLRVHHVVADGVAGVGLLAALLDLEPDAPGPPAAPWTPRAAPTAGELLGDALRRRRRALASACGRLAHPLRAARRLRASLPALRELLGEDPAPRSSLNRPVGAGRRLVFVRARLDRVKAAAHAEGATVNDVVLAAVAGGARALLRSRGEPVEGLLLRAAVPVSLRPGDPGVDGNRVGGMAVPLPVGEARPAWLLRRIAGETAVRKRRPRAPLFGGALAAPLVQRTMAHLYDHQHLVNLFVTNVPGPPVPLYLAGARLLEVFPVIPIQGNVTVGLGALSYDGQLNLGIVADGDACPDIEVFADGLRETLDRLTTAFDDRSLVAAGAGGS
jgi:WS/DGAT/MGAT family acyltransferase